MIRFMVKLLSIYIVIYITLVSISNAGPKRMQKIIESVAFKEGAPVTLLVAICSVESSLIPNKINPNDGNGRSSIGLCQVQYRTAKYMGFVGTEKELLSPQINAQYAAKYLNYQLKRYKYVWEYAIAAYNAGSIRRNEDGTLINRKYVTKVLQRLELFK